MSSSVTNYLIIDNFSAKESMLEIAGNATASGHDLGGFEPVIGVTVAILAMKPSAGIVAKRLG